jgi:hypothetical protein
MQGIVPSMWGPPGRVPATLHPLAGDDVSSTTANAVPDGAGHRA